MIADIPWYFFMVIRKRNYRSISSFKRPMGHIAHLRNNSNGQSLFLYRALIKREKWLSPFWELKVLIFLKVESPLPKDALCQVWLKWIFRRFKKKIWQRIFTILLLSPLSKRPDFSFPFHPRMPCTKFGCNWLNTSSSGKKDFQILLMNFHNFVISLVNGCDPSFEKKTTLNPHHPRMLCAKFAWN